MAGPRDLHVEDPENGAAYSAALIPVFNFCLIGKMLYLKTS